MRLNRAVPLLITALWNIASPKVNAALAGTGEVFKTDVWVSGRDGYHSYRIPSIIATKAGSLLAFCEGRKHSVSDTGDIDLLMKHSTDGGKSWKDQRVVWDDGPNTCGNPCPVLDEQTGAIWLLMTHNNGKDKETAIMAKKALGTRTVWVSCSRDDGETWYKPVEITDSAKDPSWGWYATGPGLGIQIKHGPFRGRLIIPCDHSYDDPLGNGRGLPIEYGSHVIFSRDHGSSWELGGVIRPKVNECQVVELADSQGTLLINMRAYFGRSRRAQSLSRDGGLTWTAPQDHSELVEPVCQASLLRYTWPEKFGRSRILFTNPADEKQRIKLTTRLSYDDGKTWPVAKLLHAGPAAYSCMAVTPDHSVVCLYECGEQRPYEKIALAKFTLDWLTDGNDSLGK